MLDLQRLGRRLTANYALVQSMYNMAYCCIMAFAAVFLLSRGFSNSEVGLTLTIAAGLTLIAQPMLASFADASRRVTLRQLVVGLLVVCLVAYLLLMVTPAIILPTAILYIILYCAFGSQGSLVTALAMEHVNAKVPLNFSLARGIGSFAFAVLALILGYLTNHYGGGIVAPVGVVISVLGIVLTATFPRTARPTDDTQIVTAGAAIGFGTFARQHPRFAALIGGIALLYFSHVLINTYAIQIITNVGGTNADLGIASAIGGFLELPAMALFPLLMRRFRNAGTILKLSAVALVVKTLVTLLAPSVGWLYAAQCLQFFAFAMFVPASVYYVNQVIHGSNMVKGQAGIVLGTGISGMIGSYAGGRMLDSSGGVTYMLTVGLGVSFVGLVLVLMLIEQPKHLETLATD